MTRPRIYKQLDEDLENGLRILGQLSDISARMFRRCPDALAAANYEATHGVSVAWCDTHEREVEVCRRKLLACRGIPLPRYADRVGDEVVGQVLTHAWEMQDAADIIHIAIGRMMTIARTYSHDEDPAAEMVQTTVEEENKPKCWNHMRHGYLTDAMGKNPTKVGYRGMDILDHEYRLCRWCIDTIRGTYVHAQRRELPNAAEVKRHATRNGLERCSIPALPGDQEDVERWVEEQRRYVASA